MSNCKNVCRLCKKLIISQAVNFTAGTGLVIQIPEGSYNDDSKYCIVVAQSIPAETTISAPVYIQIGTGTVLYPLTKCDCTQATACSIRNTVQELKPRQIAGFSNCLEELLALQTTD